MSIQCQEMRLTKCERAMIVFPIKLLEPPLRLQWGQFENNIGEI